jgi:hypothetical protein
MEIFFFFANSNLYAKRFSPLNQSPHLRTPNPAFNPEFTPHFCYIKGGEPQVEPGVWRPEMWADVYKDNSKYVRTLYSTIQSYNLYYYINVSPSYL